MASLARILGMSAIAFGIAACSGGDAEPESAADKYDSNQGLSLSRLVGTTKNPPDEFAVATTKPLVLPKDFAALPAPVPGKRSPLQLDPIADARAALLGVADPQPANARLSASETALLASTGAEAADSNIRDVLQAEQTARDNSRPTYVLDRILPTLRNDPAAAETLAPSEERVRLSEVLPQREIGSAEISTIPSATAPAPSLPTGTAVAPTTPVLPTVDPVTGGELIYIPE